MPISILSQISSVESSIYTLTNQISDKKRDVEKLKTTLRSLESYFELFVHSQKIVSEPELTNRTWHGELATEFSQFRYDEIVRSYSAIRMKQLHSHMEAIENKIRELNNQMNHLENSVRSKRFILDRLQKERREAYF
ncbi:DUF5082 family protein [Pseudogracilibacillus auburnensis]|uniref:Uncharacterized protein DUF5082 n=1 Tax=Pseudogracilibacillus auburnensis TaxID=1494959 RepID=A0A2V3VNZ5_9BACI|nr:DUF5082 family protein [Pseudogracilibacillus auburnensis]MBO1005476.1 DUF5082 family protein [Pseudogracilibacillus auburnensis]PXW83552.1 uncharacterized protein DUF5082 [Pseudogracilibacillus auburnensis]